jgi:hypothetical protein
MGPERKEEAMSAQGGTLAGRGTMHLPIWPAAALVVAAIAAAIGMSVLGGAGETRFVTSVTDAERFSNSTAAIREQGAVLPAIPSIRAIDPAILEQSSAAVREQGAVLPFETTLNPGMWTIAQAEAYVEGQLTYTNGLENPGAYPSHVPTYATGLENPGSYPGEVGSTPTVTWHRPAV